MTSPDDRKVVRKFKAEQQRDRSRTPAAKQRSLARRQQRANKAARTRG